MPKPPTIPHAVQWGIYLLVNGLFIYKYSMRADIVSPWVLIAAYCAFIAAICHLAARCRPGHRATTALLITATAGTMESNDIMVTLEPAQSGGIQISLTSNVLQQFGRQIEAVIRDTLTHYGIENAEVTAVDKGALDCTVRARITAAIFRSAQSDAYEWEVK